MCTQIKNTEYLCESKREKMSTVTKKHWTRYLPEAGTIYRHYGQKIESDKLRIARMRKELEAAELELWQFEKETEEIALKDWTPEEIEEAKQTALNPDPLYY